MRKTRITDGPAVRARRIALGMSLPALAERADVSASYIKAIELYANQPSDRILQALADGLCCTLDDISTARDKHRHAA